MTTSIQRTPDTEHRLDFDAGMNAERLFTHFDRIADTPDAVPRLRRFILDLAVRGKLVLQDSNDEPASELLKRIAAEKARLVKAGEIKVKNVRARERENGVEFLLPMGWELSKLGEVAIKITDGTHKTPTYVERGIPFVSVKDFSTGALNLEDTKSITREEHQNLYKRCDPRRGDLLLGRIGTLGKAVLVATDAEFSLFVSVGLIRFEHRHTVPEYLRLALNSPFVGAEFDRIKIGGSTHTNKLNLGDLHTVALPLPPLAEQHRIVAKVDELMALCDRLEAARTERETTRNRLAAASLARLNAPDPDPVAFRNDAAFALDNLTPLTTRPDQIKVLRQTILNLAVRGELVPQDPNDGPASELLREIAVEKARSGKERKIKRSEAQVPDPLHVPFILPAGWTWSTLGGICSKTGSGSTPRGGRNAYRQEGVVFLRSQNVYDEGLRIDDVAYIDTATHEKMSGTGVRPADLLLNITGGSLGRCCRVPDQFFEANVSQHVAIIRVAINGLQDFVHLLIRSPYFQSFIFDEQTGAGRGGLPKNRMDRIPVALPPLAEQHRVVTKVDELMALCDRLEASLTTRDETRGRLLESVLHEALEVAADGDHGHG